ncbi:MotA/TolQ/ExbB proton channel family protein [Neptunomonas antarctica]|uniref:Biopolymer transport protein ExbB n=1 Tax=Neptunomonas antarctica TaxID=619304 RepID=A0A1N7LQN9_9GAMM|nr:MotA/TolQ/ExbB proton channel family protein [Neptunomonas antarctica]SIS76160.1 biopolymer transport protein ExbB [Neptunomonas antarctica]
MFELITSGGWLMIPIIGCSILSLAICMERLWELRVSKIAPPELMTNVWYWLKSGSMTAEQMKEVKKSSPLGRIVVAGLNNARHGREIMKESIQEAATQVIHELERFLTALGTIAAIAPLLGLLGTVIGMIKVFTEIMVQGTGNASVLAGGISEALITTASGLAVAIPSLIFHRHFQRKIDSLVVEMEQQAVQLVEAVHGEREVDHEK